MEKELIMERKLIKLLSISTLDPSEDELTAIMNVVHNPYVNHEHGVAVVVDDKLHEAIASMTTETIDEVLEMIRTLLRTGEFQYLWGNNIPAPILNIIFSSTFDCGREDGLLPHYPVYQCWTDMVGETRVYEIGWFR